MEHAGAKVTNKKTGQLRCLIKKGQKPTDKTQNTMVVSVEERLRDKKGGMTKPA